MAPTLASEWRPVFGEHGSLEALYLDERQIIRPWGVETADARAFFSLETGGWGCQVVDRDVSREQQRLTTDLTLRMAEGLWRAHLTEEAVGNEITRDFRCQALVDTWAMDLVMRFVFAREAIQRAEIAGHVIEWDGRNYYHQYETGEALLFLDGHCVRVAVVDVSCPVGWSQHMYVRCSPREDAWVVHIRLLPATWKREVIKCRCVRSNHIVFPDRVSHGLLKVPGLARRLRYSGERGARIGSRLSSYPLGLIPKDTVINVKGCAEVS